MNKICVWADETWCWEEEVYSYNYMSDDYFLVEVPDEGFTLLKSLANTEDKDIRWIIKENLKKNRLTKAFKVNVQQVLVLLKSN